MRNAYRNRNSGEKKLTDDFSDIEINSFDDEDKEDSNKEIEEAFNSTFQKDDVVVSDSITIGSAINYTFPVEIEHDIGTIKRKEQGYGGRVVKYEIDNTQLWEQMLRIIHHRIKVGGGKHCLLNIRTISRQITRTCNIKSIAAVEREAIKLMRQKFGVIDPTDDKEYRGLKNLRGTLNFWGTVGGRTKNNRKRVARVYQVTDGEKIMGFIERVIKIERRT